MLWPAALPALVALAVTPAQASASHAPPKTVTTPNFAFVSPATPLQTGDHVVLTSTHNAPHNLTALDEHGAGGPLFSSATISANQSTPVAGTERLAPGAYTFLCTIHPTMRGAFTVVGGAPNPPPAPDPPEGVQDARVVGAVPTPTSLAVHAGRLYVASLTANAVYVLDLLPGGGLGPAVPYVTGVTSPLGVALAADGTLYVSDSHPAATPGRATAGRVWAVPKGGGDARRVGRVVVDELPNGRHNTNGLALRDGRLFIANGNSTDDGAGGGEPEQPLSGTLLSVPADATGIVVGRPTEALVRVEALGMRNVFDVAFRPGTAEAWMATNGVDEQDPDGEDTLVRADTAPSPAPPEDFGFPGCVHGPRGAVQNRNPAVTDRCDGTEVAPEQLLGLHVSANGLAFGPPGGFWDGDLVIAEFGNFSGEEVVGHKLVRVPIDASGASSPPQDLLPGGLPLDVAFSGTDLYVADFGAGVLLVKPPPATP